jgi:hypothetical protein
MKTIKSKKESMNSNAEKDWQEISRLRMEYAEENPEIIERMLNGDPTALEAFTNFGGINAKVTKVIRKRIS